MWLGMGAAIQNLLLTATALNIGTQFVSAPLERQADRERVQEIFNIPDSHEVITLLRLGYVDSRLVNPSACPPQRLYDMKITNPSIPSRYESRPTGYLPVLKQAGGSGKMPDLRVWCWISLYPSISRC